jgi:ribokinase
MSKKSMQQIIGLGLVNKDLVAQVPAWERDEKTTAAAYFEQTGGPVPVALMTLARLGGDTKPLILSVIGGDRDGEEISGWLAEDGVDTLLLQREGAEISTSKSLVIVDSRDASRTLVNVAAHLPPLRITDAHRGSLAGTRLLHIDGRDLPACLVATRIVKENRGTVSLDLGTMRPGAEQLLPLCDIILASKKGAAGAFPSVADSPERQVQEFLRLGTAVAGVTLGKNGVVIGFRSEKGTTIQAMSAIPAPDAVDSCGAGDVFHGAFLWAYLQGHDPIASTRFAQAAASLRIRRLGNRAGIPTRTDVEMLLVNDSLQ